MHIFSTLFTALSVDRALRSVEGLRDAIDWCKDLGLRKVYIESYRDGVFVDQVQLEKMRERFQEEGFITHGCVTTTKMHKLSNNNKYVPCYSYEPNLELMEEIFRRTAAVFDVIMVDDFLFTDCTCDDCDKARGGRSFGDYHSDTMVELSLERILRPAHEVNPACKVIIKYPQWYDNFYDKGYDVTRQTANFDLTWIGTELRDPDNVYWGRYPQTQALFLMGWGKKLDPAKCGGGWYDPAGTSVANYLEQARQTIICGADESMLFCYDALIREGEGARDIAALRDELPGLHKLAYLLSGKRPQGVSVPKAPGYDVPKEKFLTSFYGMLGIPVIPDADLDPEAKAVILGSQATAFPNAFIYAKDALRAGKPICFSEGFLEYFALYTLNNSVSDGNTQRRAAPGSAAQCGAAQSGSAPLVVRPGDDNWSLMDMPRGELDALRNALLEPYGVRFSAPSRVSLNLFDDDMEIIDNFNDAAVEVVIDLKGRNPKVRKIDLTLSEGNETSLSRNGSTYTIFIAPRTTVVLC